MKTRLLIIIMLVFFQMGCNKQIKDNFLSQRQFLSGELINVDCLIGKPYRLILHDTL